jgi:hypothetical protein
VAPHLWLVLLVVTVNLLPAFAPPTWSVLVYFALSYHLIEVALVLLGFASATLGRRLLSLGARRLRRVLLPRSVANVTALGQRVSERRGPLRSVEFPRTPSYLPPRFDPRGPSLSKSCSSWWLDLSG